MPRDRYAPVDLFALAPALALEFEPVLARLDELLDDDGLFWAVREDLARRRPHTLETGRPSTPVEVLLRLLIVRRLYGWSYAEAERFVGDSLILRQFCRLGQERVPDDTTLLRWANRLQPATLDRLLDLVRSPTGGSCGWIAPRCRRRATTRPTRACWPTGCAGSGG